MAVWVQGVEAKSFIIHTIGAELYVPSGINKQEFLTVLIPHYRRQIIRPKAGLFAHVLDCQLLFYLQKWRWKIIGLKKKLLALLFN